MRAIVLHERARIESVLRRDTYLHIYSLGDLDDFFRRYTVWYTLPETDTRPAKTMPVVLVYLGQDTPTILGLTRDVEALRKLLKSLAPVLPGRFYAHLSCGVESALDETHVLVSHGDCLKMGLVRPEIVESCDTAGVEVLGPGDGSELIEFYRRCYPGNWFDPRMLETERYFGIRDRGVLVSVAGVHVYSREYGVAALGNIATAPSHRGRGLARRVTARTCRALLPEVSHIGLNVRADNDAAVTAYRKLGFETVGTYREYHGRLRCI